MPLKLTRKEGETIEIDDGRVTVVIDNVRDSRVEVVVDAPEDVAVNRGEVQARIDADEEQDDG